MRKHPRLPLRCLTADQLKLVTGGDGENDMLTRTKPPRAYAGQNPSQAA